jgi:hypothetical protein
MTTTALQVTVRVLRCGDFLVLETTAKDQSTLIGYYIGDPARPADAL